MMTPADDQLTDDELTSRILEAALGEFRDYGLRRTSMDNVARRAGIARATIYRRFPNKTVLMRVVAAREVHRSMAQITRAVAGLPTVEERLVEGFVAAIRLARTDALLTRLLESEPETVLPHLTIDSEFALSAVSGFLTEQLTHSAGVCDPGAVAEVMARLGLSIVLAPRSRIGLDTDEQLRAFGHRFLVPLL
ncbi:MAG: TetR family transcriptional regulator [Streptosporangiaceae bacterium]